MNYIPYGTQCIEEDDITAVVETLKSGYLTTGPKVLEFEDELKKVTGSKYAVAVANGTAALHIATMNLNLKPDDEVITTPITFAASANCVLYCGGKPVFVDIDEDTMLIDIDIIKKAITKKTRAIIPVDYGGEICNMDELSKLADFHGLEIIHDCAHSLGSKINGKYAGEYQGQQIWSFHPVKTITTGEGGAITTNDEEMYKSLLRFRTHGITRDKTQYSYPYKNSEELEYSTWYYEMLDLGYNYRLTDFQCALGVSQLKKLDRFAKRRHEIVEQYNTAFEGLPIKVQKSPQWSDPVRHLYTIRVNDKSKRDGVFKTLTDKNIGVNLHYIPVYLMPYYKKIGYKSGICPIAEDAYDKMITIPLHQSMTDNEVEYVIECVIEAVK
ncbi:MAG: UDP-4-amino-4,6-dideoxy-N-acetyl-beta-L-altrosamine transaminase [Oscillospiraceae bacterium]|jgi:UDP-4-amino-4,6-dideoxy-N-acetyl-beta-L-altrosamine transaminase|nr:UDP-4-amino-4,6-dideoxy-N-acetyl-beta-L-altrosamine transaminase [Oscillospiraceae bacterium]